ncbi:2-hydroxy-palmitic acid dioxygenase mpo1-like [Gossypium arboreum]|uniref:2-hydroxy-palmitic acid dioxygenase mpo1-like n=1 Tax=Gossypium arboreum TaxID=29729 RepID=UPI0022F18696|nr:2-hydroxy-palmitic acid dioxygenase mpo1-like [Gossypium arboreum]
MKQPDTNKESNGSSGGKGSGRVRGKRRNCHVLRFKDVAKDAFSLNAALFLSLKKRKNISMLCTFGYPLLQNTVFLLFQIVTPYFSIQVVLVSQLLCWTGQFLGHGMFEKRAPALLDNLVQAFLMAPFFVLLEVLRSLFGYEPYPGFHMLVNAKIKAEIKEWQDKKQKKVS